MCGSANVKEIEYVRFGSDAIVAMFGVYRFEFETYSKKSGARKVICEKKPRSAKKMTVEYKTLRLVRGYNWGMTKRVMSQIIWFLLKKN
jgi:hypothetical protein